MGICYEKMRNGVPTGDTTWVDEPQDLLGEGVLVEQQRRHAAEVIARMDASRKWRRADLHFMETPQMVVGPDGATTSDGTPYADAVSKAMQSGAASVQLITNKDGSGAAVAHYRDGSEVLHEIPAKKPTQADVRAWAVAEGIEVNPMGQVPKALIQRYIEAHGG